MGWEKDYEHFRDMGHTWGFGIDDCVRPSEEESLEDDARYAAYKKELASIRVEPKDKWAKFGAELKEGVSELQDVSENTYPYDLRQQFSFRQIKACRDATDEMGYHFGLLDGFEDKDKFKVKVSYYGYLPGKSGNVHSFVASGIERPEDCLQLVANFDVIGCQTTTFYKGRFISENDTARLHKEMEKWGVSFDLKSELEKEVKQLAAELDQFVYNFDTYSYCDAVDDREEALLELEKNILNGNTKHIKEWHLDITLDEHTTEDVLTSKTLMKWLERVEDKLQKIEKEETKMREGVRVKVEGYSDELWIEDYHVRVCSEGTVTMTPEKNDKKLLITLDEIDGDRNACVSVRRSKVQVLGVEKKTSIDEKMAAVIKRSVNSGKEKLNELQKEVQR